MTRAMHAAFTRRAALEPLCIAIRLVSFQSPSPSLSVLLNVWELSSNSSVSLTILKRLNDSSSDWCIGENSPSAKIGTSASGESLFTMASPAIPSPTPPTIRPALGKCFIPLTGSPCLILGVSFLPILAPIFPIRENMDGISTFLCVRGGETWGPSADCVYV